MIKKEADQERQKKREASIRGMIIKAMIADLASTQVGHAFQTGELRKKIEEPPYRVPKGFVREIIEKDDFSMEYFSKDTEDARGEKAILYLHGGGYIGSLKNSHRRLSVEFSKAGGGCHVLAVNYRTAPEDTYPAALEDAVTAYEWLLKEKGFQSEDIAFAGDSAGGGLALCLCHYLKDHQMPLPRGIVGMSPWTDLALTGDSYKYNYENDPLFGKTKESMLFDTVYVNCEDELYDPYASPLYGDFTGFPPILLQVGDQEMMLSDTLMASEKAQKAGVQVETTVYEGMFHVFQNGVNLFPESRNAWQEVNNFLTKLWK